MKGDRWVPGEGYIKIEPQAISVKELDRAVREKLFLDLSTAPWKKDDAKLDPKAGACAVCTKRTGANQALFDDMRKGDMCLDEKCFSHKRELHLVQIQSAAKAAGKPLVALSDHYEGDKRIPSGAISNRACVVLKDKKDKKCLDIEEGIYVDGPDAGKKVSICGNKQCKVHGAFNLSRNCSDKPKDFWEERAKKLPDKINWASRLAVLEAIFANPVLKPGRDWVWEAPSNVLQIVALALLPHSAPVELLDALKLPGRKRMKPTTAARSRMSWTSSSVLRRDRPSAISCPASPSDSRSWKASKEYLWEQGNDAARLKLATEAFKVDAKKIGAEISKTLTEEFNKKRDAAKARKQLALEKGTPKPPKEKINKRRVAAAAK
jgi:hypothetical protein